MYYCKSYKSRLQRVKSPCRMKVRLLVVKFNYRFLRWLRRVKVWLCCSIWLRSSPFIFLRSRLIAVKSLILFINFFDCLLVLRADFHALIAMSRFSLLFFKAFTSCLSRSSNLALSPVMICFIGSSCWFLNLNKLLVKFQQGCSYIGYEGEKLYLL